MLSFLFLFLYSSNLINSPFLNTLIAMPPMHDLDDRDDPARPTLLHSIVAHDGFMNDSKVVCRLLAGDAHSTTGSSPIDCLFGECAIGAGSAAMGSAAMFDESASVFDESTTASWKRGGSCMSAATYLSETVGRHASASSCRTTKMGRSSCTATTETRMCFLDEEY